MESPNIRIIKINNRREAKICLKEIGCEEMGIKLMIPKAIFRAVKIKNLPCPVANIIKQEMLAQGGDAAVKRETVLGYGETDVLLLGTLRQYELLINKLKMQPLGLKKLGEKIEILLKTAEAEGPVTLELATGGRLTLGERTLIMGILNVTPDSFSDGGQFNDPQAALQRALRMVEEGADLIDMGGFSTRPGAVPVSPEEEIARLIPALKLVRQEYPGPISIDTFNAEVARVALEEGADLINDVGGLKADPEMARVVARYRCPVVIMHNRLGGGYQDLMAEVLGDLADSMELGLQNGIPRHQMIIDPGLGFGKTQEQNLCLVKRLPEFKVLGQPLLLGASRKSFIGNILNIPPQQRMEGSLTAAIIGIMNGVSIIRVHDVQSSRRAAMVADAIMRS